MFFAFCPPVTLKNCMFMQNLSILGSVEGIEQDNYSFF